MLTVPGAPLAFHVMSKPTGAVCNLDCEYCFFLSKEMLYPGSRFRMAADLQETYIRQLLEAHARVPEVVVAWQGGEPTMMGLDFFRRAIDLERRYARPGQKILNTIQTNGTLLDDEWGEFLKENGFLAGISIDGPAGMHDAYRVDKGGKPTFGRVMRGLDVLKRHGVDWNVLTTIHAVNGGHGRAVYTFLRDELGATWAARLIGKLTVPAYRQGRATTIQRWFGWLEDRDGFGGHPMTAVLAALFSAPMGRPVETERWADAVDRWQYGYPARHDDPSAEAWAALMRALLCRRGAEQMLGDADEAVRRFAAESFVTPTPVLQQGIARILCGDLDGGDTCLEDAVSVGEQIGSAEHVAVGLCERSLVAMARSEWDRAEVFAGQAHTVLCRAGIEESYATPLVSAVRARTAMHRADLPAVHQELTRAQRLRHLLTYALPHFAVQARIELARVHLALADLAGARTLMREVDDLLRRRPGLGTLVGEAGAVRAQLANERGSSVPGASALTAAELRLLPLLTTYLSFPEIAGELFLSRHTVKSEANSIYRKLGVSSRTQAVARSRELGLLEG